MAWPFSTVGPPNLDTGPGAAVPTSSTSVTAAAAWLTGVHFKNGGASEATIIMTNTAGDVLISLILPVGGEQPYEWAFRPTLGVKWSADISGVLGQIWGYV